MLCIAVYLVVAPIVESPKIEFLYAFLFVLSGLLFYFPFVFFGLQLPGFGQSQPIATPWSLYCIGAASVEQCQISDVLVIGLIAICIPRPLSLSPSFYLSVCISVYLSVSASVSVSLSHSEHRFPAPFSKACRKPVLGVCLPLSVSVCL